MTTEPMEPPPVPYPTEEELERQYQSWLVTQDSDLRALYALVQAPPTPNVRGEDNE